MVKKTQNNMYRKNRKNGAKAGRKGGPNARGRGRSQRSKTEGFPGGGPSKRDYRAAMAKPVEIAAQKERNALAYSRIANTTEDTIDILALVNPELLLQYIMGVIYHPLSTTDDPLDHVSAYSIVFNLIGNWNVLGRVYASTELPRPIWTLWKLLEAKTVGKYRFEADYNALLSWVANNPPATAYINTWPQLISTVIPNTYNSSGFATFQTNPNTGAATNETMIAKYFSKFNSFFDLVDIDSVKVRNDDASAFSFDVAGAKYPDAAALTGYTISAFAGFKNLGQGTNASLWINQTGIAGLETRIWNPHYAAIRICTPLTATSSVPATANEVGFYQSRRSPIHTLSVNAVPSVLGWNTAPATRIRGAVQLKPVPSVVSVQSLIDKFENLVSSAGGTTLSSWLSTWTSNDVKYLCMVIFRYYTRFYSGAYAGTALINQPVGASSVLTFPAQPEHHGGSCALAFARIPEFIARLIGAITPSSSSLGTIIPWYADQQSVNASLTTSLTYTGTPIIVAFPTGPEAATFNNSQVQTIVARYKAFEDVLAANMNMNISGDVGDSLLDTTLLIGNTTQCVSGMISRRPIDDAFYYTAMSNHTFMSYDYCEDSLGGTGSNVPNGVVSTNSYNQEYNQRHRRGMSNLISQSTFRQFFKAEGVVVGALTSNMSNASGTDNDNPRGDSSYFVPDQRSAPSLTLEAPNGTASVASKVLSRLVPRSGNYCGPGWTAGVDTFKRETFVTEEGKYNVEPSSLEDAICKIHDEAYRVSADAGDVRKADMAMLAELEKLRLSQGLSLYGHAMKAAIRAKVLGQDGMRAIKGKLSELTLDEY